MTASDIKMIIAMLVLIRDNALDRGEKKTAEEINTVLDVLRTKGTE